MTPAPAGAGLDTTRIDHLLNPERAAAVRVVVVGLGSGGWPVAQYLAMSGVRRWRLFDPDRLEAVNLVKHPARRADLGRPKAELMAEWLRDRNPLSEVEVRQEDVREGDALRGALDGADLVVLAVDNRPSREWVSDLCVLHGVPYVSGSVFRTGFGGQVYAWQPGPFACLRCMEEFARRRGASLEDRVPLSAEEERRIYGLEQRDFALSGLAVDIGHITAAHARMALQLLFGRSGEPLAPVDANWLVLANRPYPGAFDHPYQVRRVRLRPQRGCLVDCGRIRTPEERDRGGRPEPDRTLELGDPEAP